MTVTIRRPVRRRPIFHPLRVEALDRLTDEAVALTFAVPPELRETFAFSAGQHLTVRRSDPQTGAEARRSYSICSTPAELADAGRLRVGVKEVPGGAFSSHAVRALRAGDVVDVLPPLGRFTTEFHPGRVRRYAAVAAGSGITPVLSLIATGLAVEPASTFTLVYGNRRASTVMFIDEIADLKDRYPTRLQVIHVLSREAGQAPLLSGRIDADRMRRILDVLLPPADEWFLCGPYGMVTDVERALAERGITGVHRELFFADELPPPPPQQPSAAAGAGAGVAAAGAGAAGVGATGAAAEAGAAATIVLDGRASTVTVAPGERVLDAALRVRPELPYACRGGVCATCRARLVAGEVTMARNFALEPDEVAGGYVLTCQATPVTDRLVVDYDG